jgi:hypothetical protein
MYPGAQRWAPGEPYEAECTQGGGSVTREGASRETSQTRCYGVFIWPSQRRVFSMHTFTGVQGLAAPHRAHGPLNDGFSMHTFTEACGELVVWHRVLSTTVFPCTRSQIARPDYAIDLSTTVFPCTRSQVADHGGAQSDVRSARARGLSTTVFPCTRSQHPENQRDMTSEWSLNDGFSMHTFTDGAPGRLSTTVFPCTRSQRDPDGAAPLPKPLSTTVFPCTRSQRPSSGAMPALNDGFSMHTFTAAARRFFHAHVHRGRAPTATTASRWHSRYTRVFRR